MISGIIKVSASVISRGLRPRLITLAETLIIPDITKTSSNYCFIIHCFMEGVPASARSLTLTPSVGTGEQNTACFNLVLTN